MAREKAKGFFPVVFRVNTHTVPCNPRSANHSSWKFVHTFVKEHYYDQTTIGLGAVGVDLTWFGDCPVKTIHISTGSWF